jgi:hypothetical protein
MVQKFKRPQKQLLEEFYFIEELGLEGCPEILPRGEATQPQLFPTTFS